MKLILIPGMDGSGFLYQPLSKLLSEKGFDNVIEPLNPHIDKQAYIEFLENKYQGQDLVLVAESYGGHIATKLAIRNRLSIKKMVIMASFLKNPTMLTELEKYLSIDIIHKPKLPEAALGIALFGKKSNKELIELFKQAMQDVTPEQLKQRIQDMRTLELPNEQVDIPTLYIQASDDFLVPARNLKSYQKVFIKLSVEKLKATHMVAQGNAQECADLIEEFI